ncbi:PLP-dependent transferase [Auriscalpium vulgare]|uniref:PLP-dependent transferase n=1 Tax=Auriscalpium vulgare TaxID=40419 RepID=A0ACB8S2Q9_9AGAM|nr:PLP-dependent transferase [Auriscalpium vulgare]
MAIALTPMGDPVPASTRHAISVSLPTWADNVGYMEGDERVIDRMKSGYPRFVVHLSIRQLARVCEEKFGLPSEAAMVFPSARTAGTCSTFLTARNVPSRIVRYSVAEDACIFVVFFPTASSRLAKQFWQHTGLGVTSRFAEHCLTALSIPSRKQPNEHHVEVDTLDVQAAVDAKETLCRRIAGYLARDKYGRHMDVDVGTPVVENDVFLYPTGMSAIWSAHQLALAVRGTHKSVCFGFLYTDTLKVLEKWGPGCHFLGHGLDASIDELDALLAREQAVDPARPPVLALFTEFPSNPLLRSVDLPRLRALADKYDFLIVIDDTIGNFVNVDVLPFTDILVTSLSKLFSGAANVTGGSLVLNPARRHYVALKNSLNDTYEDIYFAPDAITMERNSRDFASRVRAIDATTERICDFLHAASLRPTSSLKEIFYPKYQTPVHYARCARPASDFGGLFTATFKTPGGARAFYDALGVYKGPSLGTNFTLACPYTIIAHYEELDWAAEWGVPCELVRVSVGLEPVGQLLSIFSDALRAADAMRA